MPVHERHYLDSTSAAPYARTIMTASTLLIGIVLLLFGRSLFWIFVGAAGFVAGVSFARTVLGPQADGIVLVAGIVAGIVGAVLSVLLERVAVGIAGFLFGGYLLATLALALGYPDVAWIAWLGGGALAALLVVALLDPALIVLSSLAGATLVAQVLPVGGAVGALIFAGALVIGLAVQFAQLR